MDRTRYEGGLGGRRGGVGYEDEENLHGGLGGGDNYGRSDSLGRGFDDGVDDPYAHDDLHGSHPSLGGGGLGGFGGLGHDQGLQHDGFDDPDHTGLHGGFGSGLGRRGHDQGFEHEEFDDPNHAGLHGGGAGRGAGAELYGRHDDLEHEGLGGADPYGQGGRLGGHGLGGHDDPYDHGDRLGSQDHPYGEEGGLGGHNDPYGDGGRIGSQGRGLDAHDDLCDDGTGGAGHGTGTHDDIYGGDGGMGGGVGRSMGMGRHDDHYGDDLASGGGRLGGLGPEQHEGLYGAALGRGLGMGGPDNPYHQQDFDHGDEGMLGGRDGFGGRPDGLFGGGLNRESGRFGEEHELGMGQHDDPHGSGFAGGTRGFGGPNDAYGSDLHDGGLGDHRLRGRQDSYGDELAGARDEMGARDGLGGMGLGRRDEFDDPHSLGGRDALSARDPRGLGGGRDSHGLGGENLRGEDAMNDQYGGLGGDRRAGAGLAGGRVSDEDPLGGPHDFGAAGLEHDLFHGPNQLRQGSLDLEDHDPLAREDRLGVGRGVGVGAGLRGRDQRLGDDPYSSVHEDEFGQARDIHGLQRDSLGHDGLLQQEFHDDPLGHEDLEHDRLSRGAGLNNDPLRQGSFGSAGKGSRVGFDDPYMHRDESLGTLGRGGSSVHDGRHPDLRDPYRQDSLSRGDQFGLHADQAGVAIGGHGLEGHRPPPGAFPGDDSFDEMGRPISAGGLADEPDHRYGEPLSRRSTGRMTEPDHEYGGPLSRRSTGRIAETDQEYGSPLSRRGTGRMSEVGQGFGQTPSRRSTGMSDADEFGERLSRRGTGSQYGTGSQRGTGSRRGTGELGNYEGLAQGESDLDGMGEPGTRLDDGTYEGSPSRRRPNHHAQYRHDDGLPLDNRIRDALGQSPPDLGQHPDIHPQYQRTRFGEENDISPFDDQLGETYGDSQPNLQPQLETNPSQRTRHRESSVDDYFYPQEEDPEMLGEEYEDEEGYGGEWGDDWNEEDWDSGSAQGVYRDQNAFERQFDDRMKGQDTRGLELAPYERDEDFDETATAIPDDYRGGRSRPASVVGYEPDPERQIGTRRPASVIGLDPNVENRLRNLSIRENQPEFIGGVDPQLDTGFGIPPEHRQRTQSEHLGGVDPQLDTRYGIPAHQRQRTQSEHPIRLQQPPIDHESEYEYEYDWDDEPDVYEQRLNHMNNVFARDDGRLDQRFQSDDWDRMTDISDHEGSTLDDIEYRVERDPLSAMDGWDYAGVGWEPEYQETPRQQVRAQFLGGLQSRGTRYLDIPSGFNNETVVDRRRGSPIINETVVDRRPIINNALVNRQALPPGQLRSGNASPTTVIHHHHHDPRIIVQNQRGVAGRAGFPAQGVPRGVGYPASRYPHAPRVHNPSYYIKGSNRNILNYPVKRMANLNGYGSLGDFSLRRLGLKNRHAQDMLALRDLRLFEDALRLDRAITEDERRRRWRERLRWEELTVEARAQRWRTMNEEQRWRLGLGPTGYWGHRFLPRDPRARAAALRKMPRLPRKAYGGYRSVVNGRPWYGPSRDELARLYRNGRYQGHHYPLTSTLSQRYVSLLGSMVARRRPPRLRTGPGVHDRAMRQASREARNARARHLNVKMLELKTRLELAELRASLSGISAKERKEAEDDMRKIRAEMDEEERKLRAEEREESRRDLIEDARDKERALREYRSEVEDTRRMEQMVRNADEKNRAQLRAIETTARRPIPSARGALPPPAGLRGLPPSRSPLARLSGLGRRI